MGFYGNITNTSNTTFQFDRIYPNRLSMDANVNNDGIFIGRYVLVEYDQNTAYPIVFINEGKFYSSPNHEGATRIQYGQSSDQIYLNDIVQNQEENVIQYYKCNGSIAEIVDGKQIIYATFENIDDKPSEHTNYITNYQIDENHYYNVTDYTEISFKGYDSTVWVKTTVNVNDKLITKYVNIADMNSVVPTFDIAADAPTMEPLTPHFDADSTNVYYKLHTQAPFGFRVKKDENGKSDEKTIHYVTEYDINNNMTTTTSETVDADIFYNKDALTFKKNDTSNRVTVNEPDEIKIVPTGKSKDFSTKYSHYSQGEDIGDIQELSIRLPSVGYMVSQGWDVIHGPNRDDARTDVNGSLQGRLDSFTDMNVNAIPVKRKIDGTLVASYINGNNNKTVEVNKILEENLSKSFDEDDAWIRTEINTANLDNETKLSGISIHHTWHKQDDTTSESDINDYGDTIDLYTPIVDAAGHVVGKNTETVTLPYGYKTFTTEGLIATQDTDIWTAGFGNIEGSKYDSSVTSNKTQSIANNTQDSMSVEPYNKWIQTKFEDDKLSIAHEIHGFDRTTNGHTNLNTEDGAKQEDNLIIYDWDFDNAGHITEKHKHTYTLPYGYKTIEVNNSNAVTAAAVSDDGKTQTADNTQDTIQFNASNKWIKLDAETEDTIKFGHLLKTVTPTTSSTSLSNEDSATVTFEVYNDFFDEAGHHNGRDTKTITMPFGYGKITGDTGNTSATATFDTLAINADDAWIATNVSTDKVNITHTGPVVSTFEPKSNIETPQFGSTFTIEDWYFDEKGHKHSRGTHTIQFPKGGLNDLAATGSSVLTGISMAPETGIIVQTNADVGTLKLTQYTQGTSGALKINNSDTINGAFQSIQSYINELDMDESQSTTQFITSIKQIDGQITVSRANAGTLVLGAESTDKTVSATDSLNLAINKIEARIKTEEENRKNAIDALYGNNGEKIAETFDTIKEIADFLEQDATNGVQSGVETIINRIDLLETKVGNSSVTAQINSKINGLNKTDAAVNGQYVSAVSESNGIISVTRADLPIYTLTSGTTNGTVKLNDGNDVAVKGLKSAAFKDESYFVSNSTYEAKVAELEGKIEELKQLINSYHPAQEES